MTITNSINVTQVSTNTSTLVAGSILPTSVGLSVGITIVNTGDDTISWILYGGNASDLSDKVTIKASTDILSGASDSYSNSLAPFAFYGVFIKSKVDDTPGTAVVRGIVKG